MQMRRLSALLAVLLTLSLVAAACGDDSTADAESTTTTTTTTAAPDDEAPEDQPATTSLPDDVELIASAPGITDTTIRLGVAIPDVTAFSNSGDQVARYQTVADQINAAGGVIGRQIDLVVTEWPLLDTTGFDAACVKLTEDEEVFAVISRTPANFGAMTCFTELGNTITINGLDLDGDEIDRSNGLLFSVLSDRFAALTGGIGLLADELADAKIAITAAEDGGGEANADELETILAEMGVDVVVTTIGTVSYSDDPTASLAEQDRFAEIWNSEGATHVIGLGNAVVGAAYAIDNVQLQDKITLITGNIGVRTLNSLGADLASLQMIGVAVADPSTLGQQGINGMAECIALMEEKLDETIIFFPEEEDLNALPSAYQACATFDFLTAALEAVGPNPTQEDFVALTDAGFSFEMTSAADASVSADKAYMNSDPGLIYDWDGDAFVLR